MSSRQFWFNVEVGWTLLSRNRCRPDRPAERGSFGAAGGSARRAGGLKRSVGEVRLEIRRTRVCANDGLAETRRCDSTK